MKEFSVTSAPQSPPSGDAMALWPTEGPGTQPELTQSQPLNITGSMATDFIIFFWFLTANYCPMCSVNAVRCSEASEQLKLSTQLQTTSRKQITGTVSRNLSPHFKDVHPYSVPATQLLHRVPPQPGVMTNDKSLLTCHGAKPQASFKSR